MSARMEGSPKLLRNYARVCGSTLARAHAKSGDAALISGYLGKTDSFDRVIGDFAMVYADRTVRDHAAPVAVVFSSAAFMFVGAM